MRPSENAVDKAHEKAIVWDCRDNHGTAVSSGRYIIRLTFDGKRSMPDQITIL